MQIVGRTHHMLVSAWGKRWREVQLIMSQAFTTYIDDSGSDPQQKVAIATGLVIPARRILALENEWNKFTKKEKFSDFHMSEFSSPATKHEIFSTWDDKKKNRVYRRVRTITKKYGVKTITFAVRKDHYDEVVPEDFKKYWGKHHYTWAVRQFITYVHDWTRKHSSGPLEYIFDYMKPRDERREEIEDVMEQAEDMTGNRGEYRNYSFRCRQEIPGLQCADVLAWVSYQVALQKFFDKPLYPHATKGWNDFSNHPTKKWREAWTVTKPDLQHAVSAERKSGKSIAKFKAWEARQSQEGTREKRRSREVRCGRA